MDEKSPTFYKLSKNDAEKIEEVKDFKPIADSSSNTGKYKLIVKEDAVRVMNGDKIHAEIECKLAAKAFIADQFYIDYKN